MAACRPPRWVALHRARLPRNIRAWLGLSGSFTAALRRQCHGPINAQVLRLVALRPTPEERRLLALRPGEAVLLRETMLRCQDCPPWVYARTLLPLKALHHGLRALFRSDNRPIGDLLFRTGQPVRRSAVAIARLDAAPLPQPLSRGPHWARRSLLVRGDTRLLVTEVLLPALPLQRDRRAAPSGNRHA